MKRFFNNLLICLFAYLLIGGLLRPTPAYAQAWRDSSFGNEYDAADDQGEVNAGAYVDRAFKGNLVSGICMTTAVMHLCTEDESKLQALFNKSAIGGLSRYIAMMYSTPPADLALWIQDTGQTLGFLPKQVFAQGITQGIGYSGLTLLLPIWKAFRNIAYFLLAAVMIVVGFMVMFRKKIDPKTVVSVQNALPRIIVTLLLITFSYAIVGIMIDLMYLVILLLVGVFKSTNLLPPPSGLLSAIGYKTNEAVFARGGLFAVFQALFPGGIFSIFSIGDLATDIIGWNLITSLAVGSIGAGIGLLFTGPGAIVGAVAGAVGIPILLTFLLSLTLLFVFVRLFFMFLTAYVNIVLALLIGPIQLLLEAFPGSNSFSSWIKNLLSNLVVFPVSAAMFMLAITFSTFADANDSIGKIWSPPFLSLSPSAQSVAALFSLGVLMIIPTVVNSIKETLKTKPVLPLGSAMGQTISSPAATGMQLITTGFYLKQLLPKDATGRIFGKNKPGGQTEP